MQNKGHGNEEQLAPFQFFWIKDDFYFITWEKYR